MGGLRFLLIKIAEKKLIKNGNEEKVDCVGKKLDFYDFVVFLSKIILEV